MLERGVNRLAVGFGMIPRGEVGLIFAGIGATLMLPSATGEQVPVISSATFGAVVIMVIITTLVTPLTLKWSLGRKRTNKITGKITANGRISSGSEGPTQGGYAPKPRGQQTGFAGNPDRRQQEVDNTPALRGVRKRETRCLPICLGYIRAIRSDQFNRPSTRNEEQ